MTTEKSKHDLVITRIFDVDDHRDVLKTNPISHVVQLTVPKEKKHERKK